MPPVTKAGGSAFRKDVQFVTKDDDEQIAAGIVMVPDKVDLQNDFAREETIEEFAEQFGNFAEVGEASGGVMHAVWPDDWMALERNEVLNEATDIGGTEAPAGAWVQEWKLNHDELWSLVTDDVLEGYSIGAVDVRWDGPFEQDADAVDDVATPDAIADDALIWELTSGIIREVSAVDIPAVPDAQILDTKSEADKRLADHLGNRDGFVEEAMERGHSEAEAERLWDVLNEAADIEGAGTPSKQSSMFARAGKAFLSALSPGSDTDGSWPAETTRNDSRTDDGATNSSEASGREKGGRTLSATNRKSVMASIDAGLDVLQDAGMDHGMTRFTDQDDVDFDLTEHQARSWNVDDGEDEDDEEEEGDKHASGSDTPDEDSTMSNDDEPPEWAKDLQEQLDEQSKRIDDLDGDGGGEGDESGKDADADDPMDEAPEWAKSLAEQVDKQGDRIDAISQQSGYSDQIDAAAEKDTDDEDALGTIGKALS